MSFDKKEDVTFLDVTGAPLFVGARVAWGAAHRSGGLAIGRIEALNIVESNPKRWDPETRQYVQSLAPVYHGAIVCKSLMKGRKGKTFRADYCALGLIADQEWPGE